jgi:hypothetical protein
MGRKPCGLHRHHLAILVQRHQRDDRGQQHGIGQEAADKLRHSQRYICQQLALTVARSGHDLAAFTK